jgi:hypothetical protein
MDEIRAGLMMHQDAVNRIEGYMQLLHIAIEQMDRPLNSVMRDRVHLLIDCFQSLVDDELKGIEVITRRVTDALVNVERGLKP